ncbi:hypothetical protein TB2_028440 [Malus domestica]
MSTTSFLDKQIMDMSQGSTQHHRKDGGGEKEHQVGGASHGNGISKEYQEMLPSYDFQPIRPVVGAFSPS